MPQCCNECAMLQCCLAIITRFFSSGSVFLDGDCAGHVAAIDVLLRHSYTKEQLEVGRPSCALLLPQCNRLIRQPSVHVFHLRTPPPPNNTAGRLWFPVVSFRPPAGEVGCF
jgi:hypothetical protein